MPDNAPNFTGETMTGIIIEGKGGPEVLKPAEMPRPVPGPGQVLVKVQAAGVNRPDIQQRIGAYPPPAGHSLLPGLEIGVMGPAPGRRHHGPIQSSLQ